MPSTRPAGRGARSAVVAAALEGGGVTVSVRGAAVGLPPTRFASSRAADRIELAPAICDTVAVPSSMPQTPPTCGRAEAPGAVAADWIVSRVRAAGSPPLSVAISDSTERPSPMVGVTMARGATPVARDAVATFRQQAPWLIASVPNEDVLPFNGHQYHVRHYRPGEFEELLHGYCIGERRTQYTKVPGDVEPGFDGRTLVVTAKRTGEGSGAAGARRPLVGRSMAAA